MHRYKDTYVRQQLKGNHESHRKEGLSVLTGFLLFLDFLLGKTISVFFFFFSLVQQILFFSAEAKSVFICTKLIGFFNVYFAFCFIKVKKNTFQTSKTKELKLMKLNVVFLCHYRQRNASIIHWLQWFYTTEKIQQFQRKSSHLDLHKFTKFTEFYPKNYTSSKACGRW